MNFMQINNRGHRHLFLFTLVLFGLFGIIFAQTFQYSRGWTNGKKRSSLGSFLFQDRNDGPEIFGICQMQRLKEIWDNRHLDEEYLPCEMIGKPDVDILDRHRRKIEVDISSRHRRKIECNSNSILDSLPSQPN